MIFKQSQPQTEEEDMAGGFEPKILAFLCKWCSYAAADLAGVSRFQYPADIRIMLTMCSGRVDPVFVLEGLRSGFDGVLVFG
jgi:F420-non-reducing hydrogenase iron-sulfur subunit